MGARGVPVKTGGSSEGEVGDGHDGTWVAHPALVPIAREVFDKRVDAGRSLMSVRTPAVRCNPAIKRGYHTFDSLH